MGEALYPYPAILGAMAAFALAGAFIIVLAARLKRYLRDRSQARAIEMLLDGRDRQAVLDEAPYDFGHWQGENGYRVYTKHDDPDQTGGEFVKMVSSPRDAEDWILQRHLSPED